MLSWVEFVKEAEEFSRLSKKMEDGWDLLKKDNREGNSYLCCKKKVRFRKSPEPLTTSLNDIISSNQCDDIAEVIHIENGMDVLLMEYHIAYSTSYQVPVLYLRAQRTDGSSLLMEEIWELFGTSALHKPNSRSDMLNVLTEMEHPVLFKPFFAIHPCRTADLLGQTEGSRNRVLTFISLIGPYVQLHLDNQYGLLENTEKMKNEIK